MLPVHLSFFISRHPGRRSTKCPPAGKNRESSEGRRSALPTMFGKRDRARGSGLIPPSKVSPVNTLSRWADVSGRLPAPCGAAATQLTTSTHLYFLDKIKSTIKKHSVRYARSPHKTCDQLVLPRTLSRPPLCSAPDSPSPFSPLAEDGETSSHTKLPGCSRGASVPVRRVRQIRMYCTSLPVLYRGGYYCATTH